jgi:hypothetical protein
VRTTRLRNYLPEFDVFTVAFMGWGGVKNGSLLQLAVDSKFEIFLTTDKNLRFQQNSTKFPIAIVVFNSVNDNLETLLLLLPKFKAVADSCEKHQVYTIE